MIQIKRFQNNPIVSQSIHIHGDFPDEYPSDNKSNAGSSWGTQGNLFNINGPSLIHIPENVPNRLGKFYLYFAHHKGKCIRMAYSDHVEGPYTLYGPGTLHLKDSLYTTTVPIVSQDVKFAADVAFGVEKSKVDVGLEPHIASPDVHYDSETKMFRMYYHGLCGNEISKFAGMQLSRVATSIDGINWKAYTEEIIKTVYLRTFKFRDEIYGLGMPGRFFCSENGISNWKRCSSYAFKNIGMCFRHCAVHLIEEKSLLYVFFSRAGDCPERLLLSIVNLKSNDWTEWEATDPIDILKAEEEWEGSMEDVEYSMRGAVSGLNNQLRDPFIFSYDDKTYLLYSIGGEFGIGGCEIRLPKKDQHEFFINNIMKKRMKNPMSDVMYTKAGALAFQEKRVISITNANHELKMKRVSSKI